MNAPGDALRDLLSDSEPLVLPGVWDPLSALVAREVGFDAVFVSGFCVAGTHLGLPDIGYLTQTEMADAARRVCAAVPDAVVVVDGDTGYGAPHNVVRTIELWEQCGAAGIFLEDQVWPKRCGHMDGKQVESCEAWLAKLRAALAHRTHLFVAARTDARGPHGLDEALDRADRAAALGVDAIFVEAPSSVAELEAIATRMPHGPGAPVLVANMVEHGATPLLTAAELGDLGFGLVLSPLAGLLAVTRALRDALGTLVDKGTMRDDLGGLAGFDEFTELVGLSHHRALDGGADGHGIT